ncbi:CoA ester lyase [Acetobacteraceae bacterium H6797]|nr:CoA ester lyase [Acetobacteraceae bacterium H6797]
MRSKLFVPGSRPELFAKAAASAADALSFDLEDAVAEPRKAEARLAVGEFLADRLPGKVVVVRVNGIDTPHFAADIEAILRPGLDIVNLPMVQDPTEVVACAEALAGAEAKLGASRQVTILANIETARGLRLAHEIAAAHPRVMGLQIGYADLLEPHGFDRQDQGVLNHVRLTVAFAAAEAGIAAYDGAYAGIKTPEIYTAEAETARRQGFAGKSCIHPTQIALANAAFMPTPAQIEHARRVVAAADEAEAKGIGAYTVDGTMVDGPFVEGARRVLSLADRAN